MGSPETCDKCGGVGSHVEGKRGFTRFPCPNATPTPPAPADGEIVIYRRGTHSHRFDTERRNKYGVPYVARPAPADDATRESARESASEAMREACAKACRKVANGTRRPSGQSSSTLSRLSAIAEGAYLCEKAIRALPLPAPASGAVEEARRAHIDVTCDPMTGRVLDVVSLGECLDDVEIASKCEITPVRASMILRDLQTRGLIAALRGANGGE